MKREDARPFWTIDAETDPFKKGRIPKPFIWGLYNGTSFHTFDETDDLIAYLREYDIIAYAHNGGKFDFHYLIEAITLAAPMKIINGRIASAKIGKCELRDSYCLFPEALARFGAKDSIDYRKMEAKIRVKHMPEIIKYLKQDCIGLWEAVDRHEIDYGRHLTQAGAAMATWEGMIDEKAPRSTADYFNEFSRFYYGGRVECFDSGYIQGPLAVYDINSAYPFAMLSQHPYGLDYLETIEPDAVEPTDFVQLQCVSKGALPFRSDTGGIYFPDDDEVREYTVTGHEFIAGVETGALSSIRLIKSYSWMDNRDFSEYVTHFWGIRQVCKTSGDKMGDIFAKYKLNSLYGKFGANPDNYGNFMCVPWDEREDYGKENEYGEQIGYTLDGTLGPHALLRAPLDDWQQRYFNVATAASITGYVRAYLWRALSSSRNVVYCDTDSIVCGETEVPTGNSLGQWKREGSVTGAWIAGKKMYALEGDFGKGATEKLASKGVKLTRAEIKAVALGAAILYEPDAPTFRLRGAPVFTNRTVKATAKPSRQQSV